MSEQNPDLIPATLHVFRDAYGRKRVLPTALDLDLADFAAEEQKDRAEDLPEDSEEQTSEKARARSLIDDLVKWNARVRDDTDKLRRVATPKNYELSIVTYDEHLKASASKKQVVGQEIVMDPTPVVRDLLKNHVWLDGRKLTPDEVGRLDNAEAEKLEIILDDCMHPNTRMLPFLFSRSGSSTTPSSTES